MKFEKPLLSGKMISRYKRFFADIELDSGEVITAHTANTGSMKSCWEPGWKAIVSQHDNPKRKLPYSLELTHSGDSWICVNTALPNQLVEEFIRSRQIPELSDWIELRREVKKGQSRLDFKLTFEDGPCFLEVKNVTLREGQRALFPDSVSTRGQKHLDELIKLKEEGHRAVMFFLVNREDVLSFSPAHAIDPIYAKKLNECHQAGVEILVYQTQVTPQEISLKQKLPFTLDSSALSSSPRPSL